MKLYRRGTTVRHGLVGDPDGSMAERHGLFGSAQSGVAGGDVAQECGDGAVVGSESSLGDGQGPLEQR